MDNKWKPYFKTCFKISIGIFLFSFLVSLLVGFSLWLSIGMALTMALTIGSLLTIIITPFYWLFYIKDKEKISRKFDFSELKQSDKNMIIALIVSATISYFLWYHSQFNSLLKLTGSGEVVIFGAFVFTTLVCAGFGSTMLNFMYSVKKSADDEKPTTNRSQHEEKSLTLTEKLSSLKKLKDSGVLTDEEFKKKRKKILDEF